MEGQISLEPNLSNKGGQQALTTTTATATVVPVYHFGASTSVAGSTTGLNPTATTSSHTLQTSEEQDLNQIPDIEEPLTRASSSMELSTTELHKSVQLGVSTADIVSLLQQLDIDPNHQEAEWLRTPFLLACYLNRLDLVKALLSDKRVDVNRAQKHGTTPFYVACQEGHAEVVRLLLKRQDVDIKKSNANLASPFYIACANGHLEVVKAIFASDREVDLEARTISGNFQWCGKTAEERAREKNHSQVADLIVEYMADREKTRGKLRRELKFLDADAAEVFALVVLHCDGYIRPSVFSSRKTASFFDMVGRLPIEIQMVVCNRLFSLSKDIVSFCDSEAAFWLLLNHAF